MEAAELIDRYNNGERHFAGAYLREANLRGVNLYGANLRGANLSGADLYWANLDGAILDGADLEEAHYSPLGILQAISIGCVSDSLTTELIKWDRDFRVFGGLSFMLWASEPERCPYAGREGRAFHFRERRECFDPGPRRMTFPQLFHAVMAELNIKV
jgi:hypothetical protein